MSCLIVTPEAYFDVETVEIIIHFFEKHIYNNKIKCYPEIIIACKRAMLRNSNFGDDLYIF